jgi:hypothetical protein
MSQKVNITVTNFKVSLETHLGPGSKMPIKLPDEGNELLYHNPCG